jgi:hypothetical protein
MCLGVVVAMRLECAWRSRNVPHLGSHSIGDYHPAAGAIQTFPTPGPRPTAISAKGTGTPTGQAAGFVETQPCAHRGAIHPEDLCRLPAEPGLATGKEAQQLDALALGMVPLLFEQSLSSSANSVIVGTTLFMTTLQMLQNRASLRVHEL